MHRRALLVLRYICSVRPLLGATLVLMGFATWMGACASLSGLSQYSSVSGDASLAAEASSDDSTVADPDSPEEVLPSADDGGGSGGGSSSAGSTMDSTPP